MFGGFGFAWYIDRADTVAGPALYNVDGGGLRSFVGRRILLRERSEGGRTRYYIMPSENR